METEELTRLVDGIYKNILDKFNPGARQLINAGKAYLKALHGAAAASRVYVDALSRLARQAQLGTWGGSQDVGSALMRIVEVYKEIQEQEMNILKAFYVDLLVPLETNLEKDTKVVQSEQKRFLQQHKTRSETYSKAAATIKKQRKKSRGASKSGLAMDKELKNMQILEEEKSKLDAFCEQSLKNAMTQERRRYGFVLERQCSLAKHYASFHEVALAALNPVDEWREVAGTREYLPQSVEDMFASRLRQVSFWPEDDENGGSELTLSSQLRKTRSMDSSCLELRLGIPPGSSQLNPGVPAHLPALSRARSEANLHASTLSLGPDAPETPPRPRSMAPASRNSGIGGVSSVGGWGEAPLARALFAYLSSGENQLSFLEGDLIALMGDRQKGWQFGENLRTQSSGWFPLAYTEVVIDDTLGSPLHGSNNGRTPEPKAMPPCKPPPSRPPVTPGIDEMSNSSQTPTNMSNSNSSQNITTPTSRQPKPIRPSGTLPSALAGGRRVQPPVPPVPPPQAVTSLHSSNDSGFSNEPPVQPDIDYSDDEVLRQRRKPRAERIADVDRAARVSREQEHTAKGVEAKNWENDSWKTIPRDEKSWLLYKSAMDLWADVNQGPCSDKAPPRYPVTNNREPSRERPRNDKDLAQNPREHMENHAAKRDKYERSSREYKLDDYDIQKRPNPNQRSKFAMERNESPGRRPQRRSNVEEYKEEKSSHQKYASEEYNAKYDGKVEKYYEDNVDGNDQSTLTNANNHRSYESDHKYDNEKSSTDSDEESTITIPETGRKVEHIAQKLEQTAQKYARDHSPPKFREKRDDGKEYSTRNEEKYEKERLHEEERFDREQFERKERLERERAFEKFQRERSSQRYDRERGRDFEKERYYQEKQASGHEQDQLRNYDKNPERNRNVERSSSRRFERPHPPFEDAPERPTNRERRYSEKEEIYGETGKIGRDPGYMEKDRGYESNFETKLERNKVIEKHSYQKIDPRAQSPLKFDKNGQKIADQNDTNNNTLKNERKIPRQNNTIGHLIQTGKTFDIETKSPKLVKRTKSFWRFRRDSEVLEGMALWQHRSLVDIPKLIRKEEREAAKVENRSRKSTPETMTSSGPNSVKDLGRAKEAERSERSEDPKPAERIHKPDKTEPYEDFPTPAERPKVTERSEYRMHHEERAYFVGNISRKAILENERKRSLEAKQNLVVAELKENNEVKKIERRKKVFGDDDDGLIQSFSETEASDEESTYSCIVVKDQVVAEKTLLPRTKLRKDSDREKERDQRNRERNTCGPWYDLWGVDASVKTKK